MKLPPNVVEWLNLLTRWFHIFAAIMWVGSTYYFTWLDGRFQEEERLSEGGERVEVWMVHSGGFYVVEKRKTPSLRRLHWFRWEAMATWLSGMLMLTIVYYMGGAMIDTAERRQKVDAAKSFYDAHKGDLDKIEQFIAAAQEARDHGEKAYALAKQLSDKLRESVAGRNSFPESWLG